jgi:hypothetical protein
MLLIIYQDLNPYLIPRVYQHPSFKSTLDRLIELDSPAGLTLSEVAGLLSRRACGRIMTKCSFFHHACSTVEVIDLTSDD